MADNKTESPKVEVKKDENEKLAPSTGTKLQDTLPAPDTASDVEQPKPTFPEPKPETLDDKIGKVVSSVVEGLLPGLIAALRPNTVAKNVARARRENDKCNECQQLKAACKGEHVKMVCYPTRYTKTGDYFRGCGLNGVWYLSNNENHYVTVPAGAQADFSRMIKTFEEREISSVTKRTGSWDFGTIGNGGKAKMPNPAKIGW